MVLFLLSIVPDVSSGQNWQDFADHEYGFAMSLPADWVVSLESADAVSIYGLPVLKYYEMVDPDDTAFVLLHFLDNPELHPLQDFLTVPREGGLVVIPWHQGISGGLAYLQVGYEYDPPFLGVIAVEILHLVELTPSLFVYLQFAATEGVEYLDILEGIVGSFSTAVPDFRTSFGNVKSLYR